MLVEIEEETYKELLDEARMLAALQYAGVRDWEGYEVAQDIYEEMTNGS